MTLFRRQHREKTLGTFVLLVTFIILSTAYRVDPGKKPGENVSQLTQALMKEAHIPGLSISVMREGREIYKKSFGLADIDKKIPVENETEFRIGSVTKLLTMSTVMRLAEDHLLNLDSSVYFYVPEFGVAGKRMTVRNLLNHTGGVRHYNPTEIQSSNSTQYNSLVSSLSRFRSDTILFAPGTRAKYSSYGFVLLGAVIEKVTGLEYNEALDKLVLRKANMKKTFPDIPDKQPDHVARFYSYSKEKGIEEAIPENYSYKWSASGYLSTASDLSLFCSNLLEQRITGKASWKSISTMSLTDAGKETGFGLGFRIGSDYYGRKVLHHGGEVEGSRAFVIIYPEERLCIAILANLYRAPIYESEAETIAGYFLEDFVKAEDPEFSRSFTTKFMDKPKNLKIVISKSGSSIEGFQDTILNPLDIVNEKNGTLRLITMTRSGIVNFWIDPAHPENSSWGFEKPLEKLTIVN